jgi:hypothetical protein
VKLLPFAATVAAVVVIASILLFWVFYEPVYHLPRVR